MVVVGVLVEVWVGLAVTVGVWVAVSVGLLLPDGTMAWVTIATGVLVFVAGAIVVTGTLVAMTNVFEGNGVNVPLAGAVDVKVRVGLAVWVRVGVRVGVLVRVIVAEGVRVEVGTRVRVAVGPPIGGKPVESTVGRIKVGTTVAVGVGVTSSCAKLLRGAISTTASSPMIRTAQWMGVKKTCFTLGIMTL